MLSEKPQLLKTIFLFGAGASRDAGIPTIDDMTSEFISDPVKSNSQLAKVLAPISAGQINDDIQKLVKVTEKFLGKADLELIMSLLLRLEDKREKKLLEVQFSELQNFDETNIQFTKELIQGFIRKKCEDIKTVDYLWPLEGMSKKQKLSIFTLNYDATVDIFCESKRIAYTDGFEPDWNPTRFEKEDNRINVFKLHGSLYWFRTKSNKTVKVPMKGLQSSLIKYLTDEEVSEMMIYPTLEKNKQLGVYSWLSQKFKEELNNSKICVVMGYSFRDGDIKDSIIESLSSNLDLWLIIASPNASKHKKEFFSYDNGIAARIVTMDMDMMSAFTDRTLNWYLENLNSTRSKEEDTWQFQSTSQFRHDTDWNWILRNYLRIGHHNRIKWIVEELSQRRFTRAGDNFPNCIEGVVGPISLQYVLDYNLKKEQVKSDIWKRIFIEYCSVLEYEFFKNSIQTVLKNKNPIRREDLPYWYNGTGSQPIAEIKKFGVELNAIQQKLKDESLRSQISKLVETINLMVMDNGKLENSNPDELVGRLRKNDLCIKKCAEKITQLL